MNAHTPGPWKRTENGTRLTGAGKRFICYLDGMDLKYSTECRANARLIAQSPALYEACKLALEVFDTAQHRGFNGEAYAIGQLQRAIRQTEGRE